MEIIINAIFLIIRLIFLGIFIKIIDRLIKWILKE